MRHTQNNDLDCEPEDLDIKDTNTCPCCLPSIYVTVSGADFLTLLKSSGASEDLLKRTEERFETVSTLNYSRLNSK